MKIIQSKDQLQSLIDDLKTQAIAINFVATMGNLHQGHLQLVKKANSLAGFSIVSIFVNPLQFNDQKDLQAYPRTIDEDIKLLEKTSCDCVFIPDVKDMYPTSDGPQVTIAVADLANDWEGQSRPGHFNGMATVVVKLFNLVQPQTAIFGRKDFQQLCIIKQLVKDLNFPIKIIDHPTHREDDGLAMSSRNSRLSLEKRKSAPLLYQSLLQFKQSLLDNPTQNIQQLQKAQLKSLTLAGFDVDYFALVYQHNLYTVMETLDTVDYSKKEMIILLAAEFDGVRLIDNLELF